MPHRVGVAWLAEIAATTMLEEANRVFPWETGGVLMGYWASAFQEVVITAAIGPGPNAVHEARSFIPDNDYHEAAVARHYASALA